MKRAIIRSTLFNIAFYIVTALCCLAFLPALLLPRALFLKVVHLYHLIIVALEYGILNLRYELRGTEHLPAQGSYLVAAKHMSAYETLKLRLIFDDPAIVLKKELLKIPLWGTFLKKSDVIAIDRSTPDKATASIKSGALRMKEQGRPIIIFPQGTRVWPHETPPDKRYKSGIYRMQSATNLPIIPMATNSGMFWPRHGWLKSSGTVIFEFLPPIPPGQEKDNMMKTLENNLENASGLLMEEAIQKNRQTFKVWPLFMAIVLPLCLLFGGLGYAALWHSTAQNIEKKYASTLKQLHIDAASKPEISGFPGPIKIKAPLETIKTPEGTITLNNIDIQAWPLPFAPITFQTSPVVIQSYRWRDPFILNQASGTIKIYEKTVEVLDSKIIHDITEARFTGTIDLSQTPAPTIDLILSVNEHGAFLKHLSERKILNKNVALFMTAGLSAFRDETGTVHVPIYQKNNALYAGPVPMFKWSTR